MRESIHSNSIRAAIDIGSNSCRLLVAQRDGDRLTPLYTARSMTRLGNAFGLMPMKSVQATIEAVSGFRDEIITRFGNIPVYAFATSAVREAKNKDMLLKPLTQMGIDVEVLSGEREASLALSFLPQSGGCIDIGGGSTELVYRGALNYNASFPMGAVRAFKLYKENQILEFIAALGDVFKPAEGLSFSKPVYGVGGTITTLAAFADGQEQYDPERVEGFILTLERLKAIVRKIAQTPREERKATPLLAERFDTIVFGAMILQYLMELLAIESVTASERDNLYSYILEMS